MLSAPHYEGPASENFDGAHFRNLEPTPPPGFGTVLSWRVCRSVEAWHGDPDAVPAAAPPERVAGDSLRATYIGHATVLLQTGGLNILLDPIWSERCSPFSWVGPRRVRPAAVSLSDLPPIDVVLISHNHYDHLDVATLRALADTHQPRILLPLGNTALLQREEIAGGEDFDWWQSSSLSADLRATLVPARHFSGRGLDDRNRTLWGGWLLETPGGPILFAGDTGYGAHFAEIRARFGAPRLAILPIGAYLPSEIMQPIHLSPAEAVQVHAELGAQASLAVHFGTFEGLADEGQDQAQRELAEALQARGLAREVFVVPEFGQALSFAPIAGPQTTDASDGSGPALLPPPAAGHGNASHDAARDNR